MATKIPIPKLGQSEETVVIDNWKVKEGDTVKKGDVIFEVETDKAVLEVESQFEGTILKILVPAGKEVPEDMAKMILAGKMRPQEAVRELNRLMQQEAVKAKQGGQAGGEAFDDGLYQGLNNGGKRGNIMGSVSSLGYGMTSTLQSSIGAHSPSREADRVGGYFLDGVYQGVANQSKRNSIFSAIWNFGSGLLNSLKASLDEHSPSKATREMGVNLLLGLSEGIDDEEKGVLDRVKDLGESMLGTLDGSIAGGISADTFAGLQNAIPSDLSAGISSTTSRLASEAQATSLSVVDQLKQALSEMKIILDDEEMGKFVDKTVTDLVYN